MKKTHFVIFRAKNKKLTNNISIKIDIEQVNSTNFLGTNSDQALSWKHHIKKVSFKIAKLSGIMIRARHYFSLKILQTIYYALHYPYLL